MMKEQSDRCRCDSGCGSTTNALTRREALQGVAAACGTSLALAHLGKAGLVQLDEATPFESLIPSDKRLEESWLDGLVARGSPVVFRGWEQQLRYVGMPIGGIGCGQLYLGGDGRLWLWDIFKSNYRREPDHAQRIDAFTLGGHYAKPVGFGEEYTRWNGADVKQGFAIRARSAKRTFVKSLDHVGFPEVTFRGEYPIGKVTYQEDEFPVEVKLEAFSPFIPLNARDSGLPATVMSFAVKNKTDSRLSVDLVGMLQNATCPHVTNPELGRRKNRISRAPGRVSLLGTIEPTANGARFNTEQREDIVFADFEQGSYSGWIAEGEAFGSRPYMVEELPSYIDLKGFQGEAVVQSHNVRDYQDEATATTSEKIAYGDGLTGTLTSEPFTISRHYISFLMSGGGHAGKTCLNLLVDGKIEDTQAGDNNHRMVVRSFDVRRHAGKQARLQIIDAVSGGWGNICVDQIVVTDAPPETTGIEHRHGYGSMALSLINLDAVQTVLGSTAVPVDADPASLFAAATEISMADDNSDRAADVQTKPLDELLVGALGAELELEPGESKTIDFAITWYFPDHHEVTAAPGHLSSLHDFENLRRHYAPWFNSAVHVADYLAENQERLCGQTRLWNRTWYDSTLPYWFLDRTFISIDCAATQMLHWFDSGRLYGWEGVDCCPGTCTHVWHYAQGLARIFPELERSFREITDFGIAFHEDSGLIGYRAENHDHEATDGQAGTVLRTYREHLVSADDGLLRRLWPRVKKAVQFLMAKDPDRNGLIEGAQPHTLDAAWYGPMAWVSGLYLGAVAAGAAMARDVGDSDFADECDQLVARGRANIVAELFDGEYFIHKADANTPNAIRSGTGCHIDQVLGQAWAHQVTLGRVIPKRETISALESLWRYNFAPDAGRYAIEHREIEQAFRWYAMPGEAGLLMCTWPKGGAKEAIPGDKLRPAKNPDVWTGPGGYFNECMNGFEYQVAAHMIYESEPGSGLVEKGLAITRAIHERYAPSKRNPYNEIECSDHYARSMASYGAFLAACGFEYHGPRATIGFAPRISPENFRAPFTCAEGWGTFRQVRDNRSLDCAIELRWGQLRLASLSAKVPADWTVRRCRVAIGDQTVPSSITQDGPRVTVTLEQGQTLAAGETIGFQFS